MNTDDEHCAVFKYACSSDCVTYSFQAQALIVVNVRQPAFRTKSSRPSPSSHDPGNQRLWDSRMARFAQIVQVTCAQEHDWTWTVKKNREISCSVLPRLCLELITNAAYTREVIAHQTGALRWDQRKSGERWVSQSRAGAASCDTSPRQTMQWPSSVASVWAEEGPGASVEAHRLEKSRGPGHGFHQPWLSLPCPFTLGHGVK